MKYWLVLALPMFLLSTSALAASSTTGIPTVTDGDTLAIRSIKFRFHGVDAPESSQTCQDARGKIYLCGQKAALALSDKIASRNVTCLEKDKDRYGRIVAVCSVGGMDLNRWLVQQGLAVAYLEYSQDYAGDESKARAAKVGLWSGVFQMPWDYRKTGAAPSSGTPAPVTSPSSDAYFKNCTEARAAGAAPLRRGQPGYRAAMDRDNDGLACE